MLVSLHVKNLALIQETEVFFGPHLNILTGETGAGKSTLSNRFRVICTAGRQRIPFRVQRHRRKLRRVRGLQRPGFFRSVQTGDGENRHYV